MTFDGGPGGHCIVEPENNIALDGIDLKVSLFIVW